MQGPRDETSGTAKDSEIFLRGGPISGDSPGGDKYGKKQAPREIDTTGDKYGKKQAPQETDTAGDKYGRKQAPRETDTTGNKYGRK